MTGCDDDYGNVQTAPPDRGSGGVELAELCERAVSIPFLTATMVC
jgi:hypothetical protein